MGQVIPLRESMDRPTALRTIRELVTDTKNVVRGPEIKGRMRQRRISWREVIQVLEKGQITEGPYLDIKGCWRCNMERFGAGHNVVVVVSICDDKLVAITTF